MTAKPWLPRRGSKVNHRNLTTAMIDSRDVPAAKRGRYFSGKNSSATVSCSGTSGKKLSRWQ